MVRSRISLISTLLVLVSVVGLCQQETSDAENAVPTGPAVATALEEAAASPPKAAPTPPAGSWGVVAAADGGGGYFQDSDSSGYAYVGYGNFGIQALGAFTGGYFGDSDQTGYAYVGYGNYGVRGFGSTSGGYFDDSDGSGYAFAAYDRASGTDNAGNANAGEYGVYGGGSKAGAYFASTAGSGGAYIGISNEGVLGYGSSEGGLFEDTNSSAFAFVAQSTYKIAGSGTLSFVQNHPYDRSSVIVYAAPEGDEVATYTRGTARLTNGEATVPLGETFKWVTNPDVGLTAHVTPRSDCEGLYVAELSTDRMVVRELHDGTSDCAFDYLVYGLRIGFEETSVVQEKKQEAYIPSMNDHRELYARRPDLRRYDALERFKGMRQAVGKSANLDLSRAHALRDAIVEFDPAVQKLPRPRMTTDEPSGELATREQRIVEREDHSPLQRRLTPEERIAPDQPSATTRIPVDADGNVYASSFRPAARDLASLVEVSETAEPGDVLVIDREHPGRMRLGRENADSGVVGIVAAAPGLVLGAKPSTQAQPDQVGQPDAGLEPGGPGNATTTLVVPVAFSGVAACKVDASYGAIFPGDLLVTSPTPGHAMAEQSPLPGTVLGKALEPLAEGTGTINVLVMLR